MESILETIKRMLGIESDYIVFDTDIMVGINAAFMALQQVGVGPEGGFTITGADEVWEDFLDSGTELEAAKQFVYLKTRLVFDPPTSSSVADAMNRTAEELIWRMNVQAEGSISA